MDVRYQRDMNHNYMVVLCEEGLEEESFETRMIFANKIPGLLSCHIRYIDGRTYLGYDVTSRQSLAVFCESRKPGTKEIRNILGSIFGIISDLEEYLLCPDHLILEPEFILMSFDTQEAELVFAPFYVKDIRTSLRETVEYLLSLTAHDDRQGIVLGYRLSHELLERNTGIPQLMDILYENGDRADENSIPDMKSDEQTRGIEETRSPAEVFSEPPEQSPYRKNESGRKRQKKALKRALTVFSAGAVLAAGIYIALHFPREYFSEYGDLPVRIGLAALVCAFAVYAGIRIKKGMMREEEKKRDRFDEEYEINYESGIYNSAGMDPGVDESAACGTEPDSVTDRIPVCECRGENLTMLLTGGDAENACCDALIPEDPSRNFPVITLASNEILIGKQEKFVSQVIDSPAVSRIHARIRRGDDGYYLRDLNSTNGTSVNGNTVFGDAEVLISEGDRITFADTVYIMKNASGM